MPDLVTRRPQRGSAYHSSVSYTEENWEKIEEPGGRHLWIKLVVASIGLAVLGTVLLALGSILFRTAMDFEEDGNTGLPLGLCVVSIGMTSMTLCLFSRWTVPAIETESKKQHFSAEKLHVAVFVAFPKNKKTRCLLSQKAYTCSFPFSFRVYHVLRQCVHRKDNDFKQMENKREAGLQKNHEKISSRFASTLIATQIGERTIFQNKTLNAGMAS